MQILFSPYSQAACNLALEDYLVHNTTANVVLLYYNQNAVVVGKHQNCFAEVNIPYATANGIGVYRRISGGGTVFHDRGNLNFSFITTENSNYKIRWDYFLPVIVEALQRIGLNIEVGTRNDLYIKGLKITGTACHIWRNRVLHHGTLLFESNLTLLHNVLHQPLEYTDKAVKSHRSPVTCIANHLVGNRFSSDEFRQQIQNFLTVFFRAEPFVLPLDCVAETERLAKHKFSSWEWNFGYSPDFQLKVSCIGSSQINQISVSKGIIVEADGSAKELIGTRFNPELFV